MKRLVIAFLMMIGTIDTAAALSSSSVPTKIPVTWGAGAPGGNITCPVPIPSQIGITPGRASWTDGFPPVTFLPPGSGGIPPFGQDFNGVLCQLSQWAQWQGASGPVFFDATFSTSVGGYPKGTVLNIAAQPTCFWISQAENNTNNPDTGGGNWTPACPGGGIGGTSGGGANAQTITTTPLFKANGSRLVFTAGFTNTGATTITWNSNGPDTIDKMSPGGALVALTGGEIDVNNTVELIWNSASSVWVLSLSGAWAYLTVPDQVLSGGANVTSLNLGTLTGGTTTIDCGARPLQFFTDNGTFTIAAPANDGSCLLLMTNGASAAVPTFSGFTVGAGAGAALDNVNTHRFTISVWRINGIASYQATALQ